MSAHRISKAAMVITMAIGAMVGAGALAGAAHPASGHQAQAIVQLTAFRVPTGPAGFDSIPNCPIPNPG